MDLMKHLGKENQIQNYKLIEKIEMIREGMGLMEKKNCIKAEVNSVFCRSNTANNNVLENNTN